jgi:hypothetical protein
MHKRIALWATPRATSTAFEWVMANRGDMSCFHEPYNEAYYHGEDRRHERYFKMDENLQPTPGLTFAAVHERLCGLGEDGPVFIKDFGYSVLHLADEAFLDTWQHAFLIRDPEKVLTSMHAHWPDIELGEIGFKDLHQLFEKVAERTGSTPLVIDSDDFVKQPEACMAAYCEAMGIPFIPESLNWEDKQKQNADRNPTWSAAAEGFHDQLKASTGIKEQKRNYPPIDSDDRLRQLYEDSLPHYQVLYEFRLRV